VVSKKIEIPCCGATVEGVAVPPSVMANLERVGGIEGLIKKAPGEKLLRKEALRNQALADNTRLKILWAVSTTELCPCILKVVTGTSDSKLSYHLHVLEDAGMVRSRRVKNWVLYSITDAGRKRIDLDRY
jgi:ArsR family transcriptional regulator